MATTMSESSEHGGKGGRDPPSPEMGSKRRELVMWAKGSDLPKSKLGVRLWRHGLPDESPAKTIINRLTEQGLSSEKGSEIILRTLDKAYEGFLKVTQEETFEKALSGKLRSSAESFVEYTSRFLTEVQKYESDERSVVPEKLKVHLLLRGAALNSIQGDKIEFGAAENADDFSVNIN